MPLGAAAIGTIAAGALSAGAAAYSNHQNAKAAEAYNQPLEQGLATAESIANQPFQAYTGNLTAPITAQESQAGALAGVTAQESQNAYKQAATPFSGGAIQQYINPYRQNVINPTLQNETTNYQTNLANLTRKANMTDAFGYGRTAAETAPLTQQYEQEYGNTEQKGLADAYSAAEGEFNKQQSAFTDLGAKLGSPATSGVGGLLAAGKDIREAGTESDQANYKEFLRGQNWSRDQIQPYLQAMGAAYKGGVQTPAYTNPLSAGIGGAISGAGLGLGLAGGSGDTSALTGSIQGTVNSWSPSSTPGAPGLAGNDDIPNYSAGGSFGGGGGGM